LLLINIFKFFNESASHQGAPTGVCSVCLCTGSAPRSLILPGNHQENPRPVPGPLWGSVFPLRPDIGADRESKEWLWSCVLSRVLLGVSSQPSPGTVQSPGGQPESTRQKNPQCHDQASQCYARAFAPVWPRTWAPGLIVALLQCPGLSFPRWKFHVEGQWNEAGQTLRLGLDGVLTGPPNFSK
jgi:hypothetical protein